MSEETAGPAKADATPRRPPARQIMEWLVTAIGIVTSGTAIWSAFTVLDATAENARARIFDRQLNACLSVSETGSTFWDELADARTLIQTRAMMAAGPEIEQTVFGPEQTRTRQETRAAEKAFARDVREIRILFPRPVSEAAIRLSAQATAASAMIDVAWETAEPATVEGLTGQVAGVRDGVGALSEACAESLATTARLARD